MNESHIDIQYSPIIDYRYANWFKTVMYNGNTLSDAERKEFVAILDETIKDYSEGLPLLHCIQDEFKNYQGEYYEIYSAVVSVMQFTVITMTDCMVACKYFILADKDYDRRFMRGKLMVILNEGFKKLYGFEHNTYKKSQWERLLSIMRCFPRAINQQFQELTYLLEKHAKSSSWWKEERDLETHIYDAEGLYNFRKEDIIESKVVIDTMKLFTTFLAINAFLTNLHACLRNFLVDKYNRGEIIHQ